MLFTSRYNDGLDKWRLTATEVREEFAKKGADVVYAFQTRNPTHAGHAYLMRTAGDKLRDQVRNVQQTGAGASGTSCLGEGGSPHAHRRGKLRHQLLPRDGGGGGAAAGTARGQGLVSLNGSRRKTRVFCV